MMDALRSLAKLARRQGHSAVQRLVTKSPPNQWIVGLRRRGEEQFDEPSGFTPVLPPADRHYADPFLVSDGALRYILIEEKRFRERGVISVMTLDDAGRISTPEPVLERPYHLSYPFVFKDGADFFLVPETSAARTVELYRAVQFPYRWTLERTLLEDVDARDSTLFKEGERYWLFTCIRSPRITNGELSIFGAPSLDGPWQAHPQNPVVADARFGRPAGRLFWHQGALIRPAQDCSSRYGEAVAFRRILELTPSHYREVHAGRLDPVWAAGLVGTHTYNADDRFEVIDGLRRR